ncbi:winged helix-turn-helix domain-containing protein [Lentzea alba]|uniref:winged helix-turn-helix domain-containing protein n=1 Tax=Lentzea alba TaxID=2714351 RepID=UPI0039BF345B
MLRLVFNRDDLQRVRIAAAPDPMWETVLSLHRLRDRRPGPRHEEWARRVRHRTDAGWLSTLFDLVPRRGGFPDFLTPGDQVTALDEGCEALAGTARHSLRADLEAVFTGHVPTWVRALADGDRDQLLGVVGATRGAYSALVAPFGHEVRAAVAADRATRLHRLSTEGVGGLLQSLPGVIGWDGRTLALAYPATRTVPLAGRGLMLIPSLFCRGAPVTLIDPDRTPVLVYPAAGPQRAPDSASLVALLGRTRADCLSALRTMYNTSQLAERLGTSVGTASKQAAVLREAGLVSSLRDGGTVWHELTPLGADLLAGRG